MKNYFIFKSLVLIINNKKTLKTVMLSYMYTLTTVLKVLKIVSQFYFYKRLTEFLKNKKLTVFT